LRFKSYSIIYGRPDEKRTSRLLTKDLKVEKVLNEICDYDRALLAEANGGGSIMEPMQCRAARGLLQWTQDELSRRAGISGTTIRGFELEQTSPNPATLTVLRMAFEKAGVEFTDGDQPGVRMRRRRK
jgi:DNA-binding transcriptional regulator YiaG